MEGVAYTTGSETAKEIHFAYQHIVNCKDRCADEIRGVLVHEVVHCYQYNGKGACPGGLIEGVAGARVPPSLLHPSVTPQPPHAQIGSAFVLALNPHTGSAAAIGGTRAITSPPTFCTG